MIPALNRDGDCLSELVLALYGSIAGRGVGAPRPGRAVPHPGRDDRSAARTAPALEGKNIANPMAMILAAGALLRYMSEAGEAMPAAAPHPARCTRRCSRRPAAGIRTPDLGGHATTSEVTDEVIARVRTKLEIWASLSGERVG